MYLGIGSVALFGLMVLIAAINLIHIARETPAERKARADYWRAIEGDIGRSSDTAQFSLQKQ